jgi:hypothetical protein
MEDTQSPMNKELKGPGAHMPVQKVNKERSGRSSPINMNSATKAGTLSNSPFSKPQASPDKSVTTANVNLYGGNIYLLGGNHVMAGNTTGKSLSTTATSAFADFSAAVGATNQDHEAAADSKSSAVRKQQKKKKGKKVKGINKNKTNEGVSNEEDERIEADIMIDATEETAPQ